MVPTIYQKLAGSPLFKGIAALKIEELLGRVRYRIKKYRPGNLIVSRGDSCDELLIILEGQARAEMIGFSGNSFEIEMIPAPRPAAPAFLFGPNRVFPVDLSAAGEVVILAIPRSSLVLLFQMNADILRNYLDAICGRAQFLGEKLHFISFKTIKEKIAHYIISRSKTGQDEVILDRNHQELSEFFGVTRPSLSRVFTTLEKEGIISYTRKAVIIRDREKLERILEESES